MKKAILTSMLGVSVGFSACSEIASQSGLRKHTASGKASFGEVEKTFMGIESEVRDWKSLSEEERNILNAENAKALAEAVNLICGRKINNTYPRAWVEVKGDLFFVYFEFEKDMGSAFEIKKPHHKLTVDEAWNLVQEGIRSHNLGEVFKLNGLSLEYKKW